MTTSDQINEIAAALAKAQGAIEGAVKGKINPAFRSKYADLGAVWDACREPLTANGIAVLQPVGKLPDGALCTITRLVHNSGQWMQDEGIPLLLGKQDMQGLGSALTYSRRYGLMSMVGIAPEDDDANAAVQVNNGSAAAMQPKAEKPAGFDKWLEGMHDVAPEGTDALKKAWAAAKPDCRQYMTKQHNDVWNGLKAKAAQAEAVPA